MRVLQIPAIPLDRMWGHGPVPPLEGALELLHEQAAWAACSKVTWFARPTHGSRSPLHGAREKHPRCVDEKHPPRLRLRSSHFPKPPIPPSLATQAKYGADLMTTHGVGSAGIGDLGTGKGSGGGDGFVHATLLMAAAHSALDGSGVTPDFGAAAAAAATAAAAAAAAAEGASASQGRSQGASQGGSQSAGQGASQGGHQGASSPGGVSPGGGRSSAELSRGLGAAFCEASYIPLPRYIPLPCYTPSPCCTPSPYARTRYIPLLCYIPLPCCTP